MTTVRAKFKVQSNENGQITLYAVYDPNPESENGKFFKYTPSGQINIGIVNESAVIPFKVGAEPYVDFIFPDEILEVNSPRDANAILEE